MTGLTCVREELAGRFACLPPHGSDFAHLTSLKHFADIYRFRAFAPKWRKISLTTPPCFTSRTDTRTTLPRTNAPKYLFACWSDRDTAVLHEDPASSHQSHQLRSPDHVQTMSSEDNPFSSFISALRVESLTYWIRDTALFTGWEFV